MPPPFHTDLASVDFSRVLADKEAIRALLPQRFEMEQLDAIVHADSTRHIVVGYKDVRSDEFWVRGHMPGYPLFPGVLMCEAAAQLCSYYVVTQHLLNADFIGFGGMENVRFRRPVHPGSRIVLVGKGTKFLSRQAVFNVQGVVNGTMVFDGDIIGMPLSREGSGR